MEHLTSLVATKHRFTTAYYAPLEERVKRFYTTIQQELQAVSLDEKLEFSKEVSYDLNSSCVNSVTTMNRALEQT